MASFDGFNLGHIFEMNTAANPVALQVNTYCGINGVGVVNHGSRGGRTMVLGALGAPDAVALRAATQAMRAYQAKGVKSLLIDVEGNQWESVRLVAFEPFGPRVNLAGSGLARRYRAEFFHQF